MVAMILPLIIDDFSNFYPVFIFFLFFSLSPSFFFFLIKFLLGVGGN